MVASKRSTLKLAEKMKWKYIGNRAGDATKGEQYIVEADELTEIYMKEMPYPQFVKVYVVQPPSPRKNYMTMRAGDIAHTKYMYTLYSNIG